MAIEVRHGIGGGAIATGAALAGAGMGALKQWEAKRRAGEIAVQDDAAQTRQLAALSAQKQMQEQSIQARATAQTQAASQAADRIALQAGLGKKLQEQRFDQESQRIHEAAKAEAQRTEWKFSVEDRRELAKAAKAHRLINESEDIAEKDKPFFHQRIDAHAAGITGSEMPVDPNKPVYPEGRGPQDTWINPVSGDTEALDRSDRIRKISGHKDSREYIEQKDTADRVDKAADRKQKFWTELCTKTKDDVHPETGEAIKRSYWPTEIQQMWDASPAGKVEVAEAAQVEAKWAEAEQATKRQQELTSWQERAELQGLPVTEAEYDLPEEVGLAQMQLREIKEKYGVKTNEDVRKIPLELHPVYFNSQQIIRTFHSQSIGR